MRCYPKKDVSKKGKKKAKGFTLIELLVVIAIIGLLSTLAVVALNNARAKARDAKRVSDVKQIQTALEMYITDQGGYPVRGTTAAPVLLGSKVVGSETDCLNNSAAGFRAGGAACTNPYMAQVPKDPTPNDVGYKYNSTDGAGTDCTSGTCANYKITFSLESGTGGLPSGAHTATAGGIQ